MAVKLYDHACKTDKALITNPKSGLWKMVYANQWSLEDWMKIVEFYTYHETFTIEIIEML